ncbi:MAG: MBL fold metallo-hydrolase [Acidimicrobiales bacterium]
MAIREDVLHVEVIETPDLGDRSYVAHDGELAIVVDPQRDLGRIQEQIAEHGLVVAVVAETHLHNDYLTGGYELARRAGAEYLLSADDDVDFARRKVSDGETIDVGGLRLTALSTPGHTFTHLSYAVANVSGPAAIFTGGSILYGSVGRTDLLGTEHAAELARLQYRSARRLAEILPDEVAVFPTHGFGSFCSAGSVSIVANATIGEERSRNIALTIEDEDTFVHRVLSTYDAYPTYYARMAPLNRRGPSAVELSSVRQVDREELLARVRAGEWVVDLRERRAFARSHFSGTVSFPLDTLFSTYVGWLIPADAPITLISPSEAELEAARVQLARIGIDELKGATTGSFDALLDGDAQASYPTTTFAGLIGLGDVVVLDVRLADEWRQAHIAGSFHIPLHELEKRVGELDDGPIAVHCGSGYRAGIAASLLQRAGRDVVLVDDGWANAENTIDSRLIVKSRPR